MKRILIVTPKFPYPPYGACEQDRAAGIEFFIKSGWEVRVITKIYGEEYKRDVEEVAKKLGVKIAPLIYKYLRPDSKKIRWGKWLRPWYWDGAAYEYSEPEIQKALAGELAAFKPDLVWFDYTYLWPLYKQVRKKGIPIVTRSINFEPRHFLEENGRAVLNYIGFFSKLLTEYLTSKWSDVMFAITPAEAKLYRKLGARRVEVLPLRGLAKCLQGRPAAVREHSPLNVFFAGSTYNVAHNRKALEFLLAQVIPEAEKQMPCQFTFHIFGGKIPQSFSKYLSDNVIVHNYLPKEKFDEIMATMDIAITPSLYGAGMQQKIFEPLVRGLSTITSARGLAGYPFKDGEHLLVAGEVKDFIRCLDILRDLQVRLKLSQASQALASRLFSLESISKIMTDAIESATLCVTTV